MRFDFQIVVEMRGALERLPVLNDRDVDVLLMSTSKSPSYPQKTVEELESTTKGKACAI
jgi:hypothetical protein